MSEDKISKKETPAFPRTSPDPEAAPAGGDVQDFMAMIREYGKPAAAAVVVAAVAALGVSAWQGRAVRQAEAESAALFSAQTPEELQQLAAAGGKSAPVALSMAASGYFRAGRYEEAMAVYRDLEAAAAPGGLSDAAALGTAACLEALGEPAAAADAIEAWLEAHPGHFMENQATLDAVRCRREAGQFARARVLCEDYELARAGDEAAVSRAQEALALVGQAERAADAAGEAPAEAPAAEAAPAAEPETAAAGEAAVE